MLIGQAEAAAPISPWVGAFDGANRIDGYEVEPSSITYTGDGSGVLQKIRWSSWTARFGRGRGVDRVSFGPAGTKARQYSVRIVVWRPRPAPSPIPIAVDIFSRMTLFYRGVRPPDEPAHFTMTWRYLNGLGAWWPPFYNGYCIHTRLAPPPQCRYAHTLPH